MFGRVAMIPREITTFYYEAIDTIGGGSDYREQDSSPTR